MPIAKGVRCEVILCIMSHMVKSSDGYDVKVPSKGATDYAVVG
jgi:hypothetical protein